MSVGEGEVVSPGEGSSDCARERSKARRRGFSLRGGACLWMDGYGAETWRRQRHIGREVYGQERWKGREGILADKMGSTT